MLRIFLIILIIIISFLLATRINIIINYNKYRKKIDLNIKRKNFNSKHFISKFKFLKTKENFLSKQGNPLNLNANKYYILKSILLISFFLIGLYNYRSIITAIVLGVMGFWILDVYITINKKNRDDEICTDILNITDSICLQLSAHVPLKDTLKKQYENCNNKDFKKAIIKFLTKYELSELDIESSLNSLKEKFDVIELNMFCNSILEYNKTDNIIEILENISETLQEKYFNKLKTITLTKVIYITFGVIIALVNIILLVFYPLFISIGQGFNNIFR